jgi:S-adenosylmethionine:tRNA ribosyltransferase-isomerase
MESKHPKEIRIEDFDYTLPEDRIALFPLEQRDASKLLLYKEGEINSLRFEDLPSVIDEGDVMVFNNSRVIHARLKFQKQTGAFIEIFCLEPGDASSGYEKSLMAHEGTTWKCLIGGISKWKYGPLSKTIKVGENITLLSAEIAGKNEDAWLIKFSWDNHSLSFLEIIEEAGSVPLPPYLKREVASSDEERYQTLYAKAQGSVAAPTAGLHFTEKIFEALQRKQVGLLELTLHVGAGTFKPVSAPVIGDHIMHSEWIEIHTALLDRLIEAGKKIIAVGTTSLRTLESLYWIGAKISKEADFDPVKGVSQWEIYDGGLLAEPVSGKQSLKALKSWMKAKGMDKLFTQTRLLITPGYRFRIVDALVTNFHQPKSTLLLLVAAATNNHWKKVYDYALANEFRFLSYGDSSFLIFEDEVKAES